jgi:general L-amino acid transport system permease protein
VIVVLLVVGIAASAYFSARINLEEMGLTSGFSFLNRDTGWSYSFSLIERSIDDTCRRTLLIGFLNTIFVGLISFLVL